uniref:Uncharacterized protein n=2 Tax=Clytia hemisphaerica TaxID=252671 RepID=A0A7M5VAW5_9CNID
MANKRQVTNGNKSPKECIVNNKGHSHIVKENQSKTGSPSTTTSQNNGKPEEFHEGNITFKHLIRKKIEEYVNNFSVHGLTRVFNGSRIESFFWMLMLTGGVCLSIVIIQGLIRKYLNYDVYTEISSMISDVNHFPSLTICEKHSFDRNYFAYCSIPIKEIITRRNEIPLNCRNRSLPINPIHHVRNRFWNNGIFNVTRCKTWGGKNCLSPKYLKSLTSVNGTCLVLNPEGTLSDMYGHVDIEFQFQVPRDRDLYDVEMKAMPHNPTITEVDFTKSLEIDSFKGYQIKLDKTIVKRLKSPYPSNCSDEKGADIFPGAYSRRSCIESNQFIEIYKICGAVYDYVDKFIPKDIKQKYKYKSENKTSIQIAQCIMSNQNREVKEVYSCTLGCVSMDLTTITTFSESKAGRLYKRRQNNRTLVYSIGLQYQFVDSYKIMEEKAVYAWDQMACEIGGFIGLVIGSSFISLIEIVAYLILKLVYKII